MLWGKKRISQSFKAFAFLLVILSLGPCLCGTHIAFADVSGNPSITNADKAVDQAFNAILEAEKAGANVTLLLSQLNEAVSLESQSKVANANGETEEADTQAKNAISISERVEADANSQKILALEESARNEQLVVTLSIVGMIIFSTVLFIVWRRFKENYAGKMLETKPKVRNK